MIQVFCVREHPDGWDCEHGYARLLTKRSTRRHIHQQYETNHFVQLPTCLQRISQNIQKVIDCDL
jgi:hypothetical protein